MELGVTDLFQITLDELVGGNTDDTQEKHGDENNPDEEERHEETKRSESGED